MSARAKSPPPRERSELASERQRGSDRRPAAKRPGSRSEAADQHSDERSRKRWNVTTKDATTNAMSARAKSPPPRERSELASERQRGSDRRPAAKRPGGRSDAADQPVPREGIEPSPSPMLYCRVPARSGRRFPFLVGDRPTAHPGEALAILPGKPPDIPGSSVVPGRGRSSYCRWMSPRTNAAWPACWRSSEITLTSRTARVTGGSHDRSTMRGRSSSVSVETYRMVCS
jgi:hypothetical protein